MHTSETRRRLRLTKPSRGVADVCCSFLRKIGTLGFCPQNLWVALCGSGGQAVEICPRPASAKRDSPPTKN